MNETNHNTQTRPPQPPASGGAAGDSRRAYLDLCQHLEHGDSDELLSDYTATMIYAIAAPERPAALDLLRSQLYSRKLAAGRVESWYVDCGVRLREDPQGFCEAAVQEHVRRGLAAEAAAQAAQKAQKAATPRLLPASAFAAEQADYLIEPYLPRGMLSILGGVSAAGKTSLALDIAAALSAGRAVGFEETPCERQSALSGSPKTACPLSQNLTVLPAPPKGEPTHLLDSAAAGLEPPLAPPLGELSPQVTERARPLTGSHRPCRIFYLTAENDANKVLRPRLERLGADLDRVFLQCGASFHMREPLLWDLCRAYKPDLLVFDPIQSFLGPGVQMNRAEQVRPIMDELIALAKELDMAVLLISHMSKPGPGVSSALDRLLGSSDFRNSARSILIAGADPEQPGSRVFAHAKNSLGAPGPSQRYHISAGGVVEYDGACTLSADRILATGAEAPASRRRAAPTLADATRALSDLLAPQGWVDVKRAYRLCEERGFSDTTLRKARDELGLRTLRVGRNENRHFFWFCPDRSVGAIRTDILNRNEQLLLMENAALTDRPAPPGDEDAPVQSFKAV